VSGSVILHDFRMIHGDICRPLFEVTYRIAARGHHIGQQLVGLGYRASGAVNKPRLDPAPGLHEARTITHPERPDVESLDSLFALVEPGFRMPPAPPFLHGAGVLNATELRAQSCRAALSENNPPDDSSNHNHGKTDD